MKYIKIAQHKQKSSKIMEAIRIEMLDIEAPRVIEYLKKQHLNKVAKELI